MAFIPSQPVPPRPVRLYNRTHTYPHVPTRTHTQHFVIDEIVLKDTRVRLSPAVWRDLMLTAFDGGEDSASPGLVRWGTIARARSNCCTLIKCPPFLLFSRSDRMRWVRSLEKTKADTESCIGPLSQFS